MRSGVKQRELDHRAFPIMSGAGPFGNDVAQRQPNQPERGLLAREVAARFDDLAQLHVERLNGICRVDARIAITEPNLHRIAPSSGTDCIRRKVSVCRLLSAVCFMYQIRTKTLSLR